MPKIMIIGASILQLPAILKAKEMGFCVAVADYNPNAVGVPYADRYFNVSTVDTEEITKAAMIFRPDGIITLATDRPMLAVAKACAACGLPGIDLETARRATNKADMIRCFDAHGVECPWHQVIGNPQELRAVKSSLAFPCVIKPADNSGSRGVVLIQKPEDLEDGYSYALSNAQNGVVIAEEYLEGPEVSVEAMVIDSHTHVLQITDKLTSGPPYFVEMGHSQPSRLPAEQLARITDLADRAARAIGISTGAAHIEIILTKDGPKMVELGARLGGDFITTHLLPLSTGIDILKAVIHAACGLPIDIEKRWEKGAAIRYFDTPVGVLRRVEGLDEARKVPGVSEITFLKNIGDSVDLIRNSGDRAGFVIAQGQDAAEAVEVCDRAISLIKMTIE